MSAPQISVVIPAFNAAGTIGRQIEALRRQVDAPLFEVIVADNRSTDATAQAARACAGGLDLRVVPAVERQGVNCARNAGVRAAQAPLIVLIDADDVIDPRALRAFADAAAASPGAGIISGVLSMHDPETFELERPQGYLPYAPGCLMAVRRAAFDAVGGFDESFVGGHDEVDFAWRVQHAGWDVALARGARLERIERSSPRGAFCQFQRYGYTYIQLYARHRARGIAGSSWRAERPLVKRVLRQLPRLRARSVADRIDAAGFIGWHIGRWTGDLRFRTWGPK